MTYTEINDHHLGCLKQGAKTLLLMDILDDVREWDWHSVNKTDFIYPISVLYIKSRFSEEFLIIVDKNRDIFKMDYNVSLLYHNLVTNFCDHRNDLSFPHIYSLAVL